MWTYATRVLTASTNFNDISASDVRTELAVELARIDAAVSSRSSHDAAAVLTAFGTGAALTACLTGGDATAANQAAISGLISALNNLSSGDVSAALATYDGPTNAEMTAAFTEIKGATWDSATDTLELIRNAAGSGGSGGLTPLASGTAQSGTTNTIRLAAASTFADDDLIGAIINITGGSGAGQHRVIYDYVAATDTAYVSPDWNTAVASDSTYEVVPGASNVTLVGGSIPVESDSVPAKLTADGLDNIPITAPSGAATDFREMLVQVWRRFFKRANRTYSGGTKTIKTYADDGTTVLTTQVIADDGTTEEQGVAS